ncbi:MAG: hypothetical protein IH911_06330 [Proteobacteria bacterium]|nr:hypothetical protein [Pseudomonadota bacterium]
MTNDDLARWIRQAYPGYQIDASVIKNIKTHRKINEALELYDSVVLPMRLNEDFDFLEKIEAMVDFPLQPYIDLGFHRFKLLRARPGHMTGY